MEHEYGYCKNESWGFYNLITKKFNLQNQDIKIINASKLDTPIFY